MEWTSFVGWILSPVCSELVGVVITHARQIRSSDNAMKEGMRVLLRQQLIALHEEWVLEKGYAPVYIKELSTSIYNAYHELRGNGTGTQVHKEIMACPSEEKTHD